MTPEDEMTAITVFESIPENYHKKKEDIPLILAHGAGAPADSEFMECLAGALMSEGVATFRFEFPYMERRREDGRKRPPDRQAVLLGRFREIIRQIAGEGRVVIGGKSMGGRVASLLAAEPDMGKFVAGCACFGYPFHPPGKPGQWRVEHFGRFFCPVMIVQGTRDPFGRREEVENRSEVAGSDCTIHWLEGGNHDFRPPARQSETQETLIRSAAVAVSAFIAGLS